MDTKKKRMIYVGTAVLVSVLTLWFFLRETPVAVETAVTKRGPMLVTVDGEGKTRVRNKTTVTAPISGKMSRIRLTEGDNIPHDYPIAEIDPNPPIQRATDPNDERPNIYAAKVFAPIAGKVLRIFDKSERFVAAGAPLLEIGDPNDLEIVVDILDRSREDHARSSNIDREHESSGAGQSPSSPRRATSHHKSLRSRRRRAAGKCNR